MYKDAPKMTPLRLGEAVTLAPGGTPYRVTRTGACSATLKPMAAGRTRTVTVHAKDGTERTFEVSQERPLEVSPNAFVYREE